ncbi:MAG: class I SAM-dependent methyltransferase [bacterium]
MTDEIGRDKIRESLKDCKEILDVGCNSEKIRKDAAGVDIKDYGQEYISDYGELCLPPERFDGISMSHFLEHMSDTRKSLAFSRNILKEGGKIAISVPHGEDVPSDTLGDSDMDHECIFTPMVLKKYLEHAGFRDVKVEEYYRTKRVRGIFAEAVK